MTFLSHNDTIKSDPVSMQGYVSYRSDVWGLPDNTAGKIGWYNVYQMRDALLTSKMKTAGRAHNAARRAAELLAEENRQLDDRDTAFGNQPCPKCGTYCCGDCEA